MKNDVLLKRIYAYGVGVIVIAMWALMNLISYDLAMMLASLVLAFCFSYEAFTIYKGQKMKQFVKLSTSFFLVFLVLVLIVMKVRFLI